MIISHKYKFIFVKTPKTAGTSVEIALAHHCGKEDVIAFNPLFASQGLIAQNFEGFQEHNNAKKIKEKISSEIWNNYFKFAFERNPFDKMVSMYCWRVGGDAFKGTFKDFCIDCKNNPENFPPGFRVYGIDNQIAVDFVGRYETLNKDFQYVCKKLNIPCEGDLPKIRNKSRKTKKHYSEYYDDECKRIVEEHYSKELSNFKYAFEEK